MPIDRRNLPSYIKKAPRGEWIVIEENKRAARFHNPDNGSVLVIHVDGGLITTGERADYIVAHPRTVDVIVELKGNDVGKAIRQIRATRPVWLRNELAGKRHAALVVRSQGIHPRTTASIDRWQREFRKTLKMKLVVETRNRDYEFAEFLLPEASRA
jgi:FtsP/CotA-like multicopper oxidase with cupredoxin domain